MVFYHVRRSIQSGTQTLLASMRYVASLPEIGATILLGGLLWKYGIWLVVPSFFVMGFFLRVLRDIPSRSDEPDVTDPEPSPPRFVRWLSLFVEGARAYVIWTSYLFFAFAGVISLGGVEQSGDVFVMLLGLLLGNYSFLLNVRKAVGAEAFAGGSISLSSLYDPTVLVFLVSMYVAPAALLNLAARRRLTDGFDFDAIRLLLVSPSYAGHWVVFVLLWFVSSVILLLPVDWVTSMFVPWDVRALFEGVRESIEILTGLLSFAVLLFGYTILGRVPVPPTDPVSLHERVGRLFGPHLSSLSRSTGRLGQVLLVGGLLGSFWSLPAFVLLAGYVVRFVRAVQSGRPLPTFANLPELLVDGTRAVVVWFVLAIVPLTLLHAWEGTAPLDGYLLTALSGVPGLVVGRWYVGRDLYIAVDTALPTGWTALGGDETLLSLGLVVTTLLFAYLYPASLVGIAETRRLRAGLAPAALARRVTRRSYPFAWLRGMALFAVGGTLSILWNWWRLGKSGSDTTTLVPVGPFNIVTVPTELGLKSSLLLLAVSTVGVVLLLRAYDGIAVALVSEESKE